MLPDVPVIVTVAAPVAALLVAVRVSVLLLVAEAGLNDAVTPLGRPEAARLTLPVKPFNLPTVTVLELPNPCASVRLAGEAVRLKSGGGVTVSASVAVWLRLPDVPVIVTVAAPVAALLLAVSVNVLLLVAEAGLNDAVTPLGRPEVARAALPVKPFNAATDTMLVPLFPCVIIKLPGDVDREKFGAAFTVSAKVVVWLRLPDVPVIVTVAVPVAALPLAVSVNVLLLVVEPGVNDAVTPLGKPEAAMLTLPVKPFNAATEIVLVPLVPCVIARLEGVVERLKSAVAAGVNVATDW
jgi:hypothetical protein